MTSEQERKLVAWAEPQIIEPGDTVLQPHDLSPLARYIWQLIRPSTESVEIRSVVSGYAALQDAKAKRPPTHEELQRAYEQIVALEGVSSVVLSYPYRGTSAVRERRIQLHSTDQ